MKILLFGKHGQLGWELNRSLRPLGEIVVFDRESADFSAPESLCKIVQSERPDIICNAVAYTAVDKAEDDEVLAVKINGEAPGVLAEEAKKLGALMVHYSTDYVFDGTKNTPYTEADEPGPVNAYGRSKLAGEIAVKSSGCDYLILRTSWVYASRAHNFMLTVLKLAQEREEISIVSDQIGAPTSARLIADITLLSVRQAVKERASGVFSSDLYHLTASGCTSWHGFAEKVVEIAKNTFNQPLKISEIRAITTAEYPTPAKRPENSRLQFTRLEEYLGLTIPNWESLLALCMEEVMG